MFGGVPYYLNLVDRRSSLAQNIDQLCFDEAGQLRYELDRLFTSLFKHASKHVAIVRELARRKGGMSRAELAAIPAIGDGSQLTRALEELVQCGFVRRYRDFVKAHRGARFQLIDPFTLFSIRFLEGDAQPAWSARVNTPAYYSWRGGAFELVCLLHSTQIREALRVGGVASTESAWRSSDSDPGAQVDLVIDRADGVVNLCEMKCTDGEFAIDKAYAADLRNKVAAFVSETGTRKAVHITMLTANGLAHNAHWGVVQNELTVDDLFAG